MGGSVSEKLMVFSDKPISATNVWPRVVLRCPKQGYVYARAVDPISFYPLHSQNPGRSEITYNYCSEAGKVIDPANYILADIEGFQAVLYWTGEEDNPEQIAVLMLARVKDYVKEVEAGEGGKAVGAIVDKVAGLQMSYVGKRLWVFDSQRLMGLGYIDYPKEHRMQLALPPGFVSEKVAVALVEVRFRASSIDALDAQLMMMGGNVLGEHVVEVAALPQPDRIKVLAPFAAARMFSLLGWVYGTIVDLENLEVKTKIALKGGFLNIDPGTLGAAILGGLGGCAVGAKLGAAIGSAIAPGVGTIAGAGVACAVGAIGGAALMVKIEKSIEEFLSGVFGGSAQQIIEEAKRDIDNDVDRTKRELKKQVDEARQTVEHYHETGDISDRAYTALMSQLNEIENEIDVRLEELKTETYKVLERAVRKASTRSTGKTLMIAGGALLGGIVIGAVMSRR